MRKLKVDLSELAFVFESGFHELSNYLDLETGEIVVVTDDTRGYLEAIYEAMNSEGGEASPALATLVAESGLHEWQQQAVLQADAVERGYGDRFIPVPQMDSHEAYRDMEDFSATVRNPHIRELLEVAITGRGAFRRFKDAFYNYPHEEKRWFAFKEARMVERVREWLEAHDIEPIIDEA
jgi:hypothetical protein